MFLTEYIEMFLIYINLKLKYSAQVTTVHQVLSVTLDVYLL